MVKTDACVVQLRISRRGDLGDHNCAAGNWILTKLATAFKRETPTNSSPLVRTAADRLLRVVSIEGTDMSSQKRERLLPYTCEQLFDLAADVERYPEYLPWWIAARIRRREGNTYVTDQVLGLGPIRVSFGSRTVLQPPTWIDVTSKDFPFRQFKLSWSFVAVAETGCRVSLIAEFELRSFLLQGILDRALPGVTAEVIAAFEARAHSLYQRTKIAHI